MCAQCGKIVYKRRTSIKLVRFFGLLFLLTIVYLSFSQDFDRILEESPIQQVLGVPVSSSVNLKGTYNPGPNCKLSSGKVVPFQIADHQKDGSILWNKKGVGADSTYLNGSFNAKNKVLSLEGFANFEVLADEFGIINLITIENNTGCNTYFKNN